MNSHFQFKNSRIFDVLIIVGIDFAACISGTIHILFPNSDFRNASERAMIIDSRNSEHRCNQLNAQLKTEKEHLANLLNEHLKEEHELRTKKCV